MRDEMVLESTGQIRALAHPTRLRILWLLSDSRLTNKQLATVLTEPAARIHFHVRELANAGLIELVEERPKGGVIEKYYQSAARNFRLTPEIGSIASESPLLIDATMTATRQDLAEAESYFGGTPSGTRTFREHGRLSPEAQERLTAHLDALETEMVAARDSAHHDPNGKLMMFTYMLYPLPDRALDDPRDEDP